MIILDNEQEYDFNPESFEDKEDVKSYVRDFAKNTETGQIVSIVDLGPHVVIKTEMGINVYPLVYFRNYLASDPNTEPLPLAVVRAIVREWFEGISK